MKPRVATAPLLAVLCASCVSYHVGALPNEPREGAFANVRGVRVHYVDEGPEGAPAVVLVHGFASSLGVWAGIRPALRERFRVLSLDLKGFGDTDRPAPTSDHGYSADEQARLVLELMAARGFERAAVVAHSYGSSVALAMALQAPEKVTRVALYDAWVYPEQLPTSFHWARAPGLGEMIFGLFYDQRSEDKIALAFFDPELIPQALVDAVEEQVSRPGTKAAALAAVRAMRYEAQAARYREIQQETLLLWGREDAVTSLEYGERLSNELPSARLVVFPRCGHFPMIEAAVPSTRELVAFLSADAAERSTTDASSGVTSSGVTSSGVTSSGVISSGVISSGFDVDIDAVTDPNDNRDADCDRDTVPDTGSGSSGARGGW